jgi:hypothetical protein
LNCKTSDILLPLHKNRLSNGHVRSRGILYQKS